MDVYTVVVSAGSYILERVFDRYESLIWTERFSAWGDFEFKLHSTYANRSQLTTGVMLTIRESHRVMVIETTEDTIDLEGRQVLILRGRSLEAILEGRLAFPDLDDLTTIPKWSITDLPADIARTMFTAICVTGVVDLGDIIPDIIDARPPGVYPDDTILEPSDTVTYEIDPMSLYQAIKDLCDIFRMGFRFTRHPYNNALYWDVYMGCDRTSQQTELAAVIFSKALDNLSNTSELQSISLYKNAAYVLSPVGAEVVYPDDVDPSIEGFQRRAMFVVAQDITDVVPADATAKMIQRGKEQLAQHRRFAAFDGELNQNNPYIYGVDYNLGDLIEFQNEDGASSLMRVAEQIFVSDKEGVRSYPSLVIDSFIVPGSIGDWAPDEFINDVDPGLVINDA